LNRSALVTSMVLCTVNLGANRPFSPIKGVVPFLSVLTPFCCGFGIPFLVVEQLNCLGC
jgi:hypothetical protein